MTTNSDEGDLLFRVSGIVPADDFRPFVLQLAHRIRLRGWVASDNRGALIRAIGIEPQLVSFLHAILHDGPPSLRIRSVDVEPVSSAAIPAGDSFVSVSDEHAEFAAAATNSEAPMLSRVA